MKINNYLSKEVRTIINKIKPEIAKDVLEIRLRVNKPLQLTTFMQDFFVKETGEITKDYKQGYYISKKMIEDTFMILTKNSIYAIERQLKEGFLTITGGHRIGFTGQALVKNGKIETLKNINSLNFRITKEVQGIGEKIVSQIYNKNSNNIYNTLIIGPPLCGKTTLLRDLIRIISNGSKKNNILGKKIALVDERSEVAGSYEGVPQNDIGAKTDVLDNCPKAEGIMILIRAMAPQVIAVDEIGRKKDVEAIKEATNAGVKIIATVHGDSLESVKIRPNIQDLIQECFFQKYIILDMGKDKKNIQVVKDINHL
ncbi:MAG: stage III sporulation protein AA [bacterium]